MRLVHKKELGCQAMAPVVIKEEVRENSKLAKIEKFWQLLGGKRGVKCKCVKKVNISPKFFYALYFFDLYLKYFGWSTIIGVG